MTDVAVELNLPALGAEHLTTLRMAYEPRRALPADRELEGAQRILQMEYDIRRRASGSGHPDLPRSVVGLTTTLLELEDLAGAQAVLALALKGCVHTFGAANQRNIACTVQLCRTPGAMSRADEALALIKSAHSTRLRTPGAEAEAVLDAGEELASALLAIVAWSQCRQLLSNGRDGVPTHACHP